MKFNKVITTDVFISNKKLLIIYTMLLAVVFNLLPCLGMAATVTTIQLTNTDTPIISYGYSDNGEHIVFYTTADLLGENPSKNEQLYYIQADGSGLRQLTSFINQEQIHGLLISADGSHVVTRIYQNSLTSILSINLSNDSHTWLTSPMSGSIGINAISPDGEYIIYEIRSSQITVHYIETDGGNYRQLPGYSRSFAYVSADASTYVTSWYSRITAVDVLGTRGWKDNTRTVLEWAYDADTYIQANGISDDGNKIAFYTNYDFDNGIAGTYRHIYLVNTDGTNFTRVTDSNAVGQSEFPYYMKGAEDVIFSSRASLVQANPDSSSDIYIYNIPSASLNQLTNFDDGNTSLQYHESENRNRVVYSRASPLGGYDTVIKNMDGTNEVVVNSASRWYGGTLSVEGNAFVYLSEKDPLGTNPDNSLELFIRCESASNVDNACATLTTEINDTVSDGGSGSTSVIIVFFLWLAALQRIIYKKTAMWKNE
ncbi:MAG: hypothetical protein PVJ39_16510 [Gammaproteobacteria bacterium]|jgi:hypothetical protein